MIPSLIWEAAGAVIVAGFVARMIVDTFASLAEARGGRRQQKLDLQLLKTELEMMRDLRLRRAECAPPWSGFRKFLVTRKVIEAPGVCSFYLSPHDRKPVPDFLPGQYLTFQLDIPGRDKPLIRCYSLSDGPRPDGFRVTIKRVPAPDDVTPPGLASSFFHDQVKEGDILDVKAPSGNFYLDPAGPGGVVLIGGGIGVTPVLAMLNTLAGLGSTREIHFFYGIRDQSEQVMRNHIETIAREHPNVRIHVCASKPGVEDKLGVSYQHEGRVSVDLFKQVLPSNNYDFYICGPGPMMQSLNEGLREWDVPESKIHFETFGPSSVKKVAPLEPVVGSALAGYSIQFKKSGKTVPWTAEAGNLLELAEANGINIACGCRAGSCGTCRVAIFSGQVDYLEKCDYETEPGTRLTCIGIPKSDLVMDA